jgi:hypothetical protein
VFNQIELTDLSAPKQPNNMEVGGRRTTDQRHGEDRTSSELRTCAATRIRTPRCVVRMSG